MSSAIERALRDVSARRLRTHKLAKTELLHLADQRASLLLLLLLSSSCFLVELDCGWETVGTNDSTSI
jgi:hypothetical protein